MYRHSPVRNPRSKGIKIKHVVQVCLLVAVCFWLIFQLKRSQDKKKEFDVTDRLSTRTHGSDEIMKFGRKDLPTKLDEKRTEVNIHEHEQEDEEEQDEDKMDEEKDNGGGGGDDEIDENEQEKLEVEIDRDEVDIIDQDKETEESDGEKENEEKEDESQTENGVSLDKDGGAAHTHEAREENYKADDASSAVTHNARTLGTENEMKNGTLENSSEDVVGQTFKNESSSNIQENDSQSIVTKDSRDNGPPSNTTVISSDSSIVPNATLTEATEGSSNSTSNESNDADEGENLDINNVMEGTEESLDPDEVQHDTIDSTDPAHLEEKEVRTDLDTLPEIETEGGNSEDTAAE